MYGGEGRGEVASIEHFCFGKYGHLMFNFIYIPKQKSPVMSFIS